LTAFSLREFLALAVRDFQDQTRDTRELLEQSLAASDIPLRRGQGLFASYLEELLGLLAARVDSIDSALPSVGEIALRAHARRLFSSSLVLEIVSMSIGWLGVDQSLLVSSGLNPHLRKLAASYMGEAEVVIHTTDRINYYSIMNEVVLHSAAAFMQELDGSLTDRYNHFCLFGLPISQAENVLLHAILYHELGHKVDSSLGLSDQVSNDSVSLITSAAPTEPVALSMFKQTLRSWVAELVADALGVAWSGPACLIASLSLWTSTSIDLLSPSHPTDRVRYELMLAIMERTGALPYFEEYLPTGFARLQFLLSQPVQLQLPPNMEPTEAAALETAHDALRAIQPLVIERILSASRDQAAEWQPSTKAALDYALLLLENLVVPLRAGPAEDARFLEPSELLLAGWCHITERQLARLVAKTRDESEDPQGEVRRLRLRHYRHIEKALQDRELTENWEAARGRLNDC